MQGESVRGFNLDGSLMCGSGSASTTTFFRDADGDAFGNAALTTQASVQPDGYVTNGDDCDDGDAAVHPGAPEVLNQRDDDCDGTADEGIQASLAGVSLAQPSVQLGTNVAGTVSLTAAAETDVTVTLETTDSTVAAVPASVTVPAGQGSADFTVTTFGTGQTEIRATYGGVSSTVTLEVTSGSATP